MDKKTNQQPNPSLLPDNTSAVAPATTVIIVPKEESSRKPFGSNGGGGATGGDRLKRDDWSEGAVSSLLEAYERKWVLRHRAKLKGHDWEDVARYVSSRANCTKSPKTQTQCKNKIEAMKKRYRSESNADASSWPLYSRLGLLLGGRNGPSAAVAAQTHVQPPLPPIPPSNNSALGLLDPILAAPQPPLPQLLPLSLPSTGPPPPPVGTAHNSRGSNGIDRLVKQDEAVNKILSDHASDKNNNSMEVTSDSSTPALYVKKAEKIRLRSKTTKMMRMEKKKRKRKELEFDIEKSIRWLAEAVVKSEEARMETMREIERMRVEGEAKRAEMDLKRTEIVASTQLEIAGLFAASGAGKAVDSSLRIGRN